MVGNVTYLPGERWSEDECTQCICEEGHKKCTEKVCSVICSNAIKIPGRCCPVCPGNFFITLYLDHDNSSAYITITKI